MFLAAAAPFIVLASTVVANHLSLPFIKRVKSTGTGATGPHFVVRRQDERSNSFFTFSLGNISTYYYEISVSIGNPPINYNLLVDTGNPFTWVGADSGHPYVLTNTSMKSNNSLSTTYGYGSDAWPMNGMIYTDNLFLGGNSQASVSGQGIGVALGSTGLSGISGVDGFLGLGPTTMTTGSLHPGVNQSLATVPDNMNSQQSLTFDTFSVYMEPVNDSSTTFLGELRFGDYDTNKINEQDLVYAPVSTMYGANGTWSVDISIRYDGYDSPIIDSAPCIVDSKSPYNYFPSVAFSQYVKATGAIPDPETGLLRLPPNGYKNLQFLWIEVFDLKYNRSVELKVIPNAQILPRALNKDFGGTSDNVYLTVKDLGSPLPNKPLCVLGIPFLERCYTVFDLRNNQIGLAPTPFSWSEIN